jgi:hypothetical protein
MADRQMKAYGFMASLEFIEKNYDEAGRKRILSGLSPDARKFVDVAKKSQFAPPHYSSELWSGIVKEAPDAESAQAQLVKVGRHMGAFATTTYLKLLMKMLTVKMFAKKFPDLWARDANFGTVSLGDLAQIEVGELSINFKDLEKYPYFGPICEGWFAFSLETMGLKELKVKVLNWSMQNPDPGELSYRITWAR